MTSRRLEIDIDEETATGLRRLAEVNGMSVEAIVLDAIARAVGGETARRAAIVALGREIALRDAAILDALAKV